MDYQLQLKKILIYFSFIRTKMHLIEMGLKMTSIECPIQCELRLTSITS